jgi:hypothetical protein
MYKSIQQQIQVKVVSIEHLEQKKLLIPDMQYQVDVLRQHNEQVQHDLQETLHKQKFVDPYVLLEHVLSSIDEIGLQLVLLTPQEFKRKAFYEKCSFTVKALGTYNQLMQLLNHFCQKHPNAVLKKVSIVRSEDKLILEALVIVYLVDRDGL